MFACMRAQQRIADRMVTADGQELGAGRKHLVCRFFDTRHHAVRVGSKACYVAKVSNLEFVAEMIFPRPDTPRELCHGERHFAHTARAEASTGPAGGRKVKGHAHHGDVEAFGAGRKRHTQKTDQARIGFHHALGHGICSLKA